MSEIPQTERPNAQSAGLDRLSTSALVELLVADQRRAVDAVFEQAEQIAQVIDEIVARLERGGTLHYVGAGSSGRIAMLDAVEMPPTFGTPYELVRAHVAGGTPALMRSVEGAEDDAAAGDAAVGDTVHAVDAVVGVSASGGAAFVVAAIERARRLGSYTVAITSVDGSPLDRAAERSIVLSTGAEALAGSTRLKAGTAQKIALNAISTAVMVRLGKAYDNLMVDVVANNRKLRARANRLVREIAGVDGPRAQQLLEEAGGSVKVAIVMHRGGIDAAQAGALLESHAGSLRNVIVSLSKDSVH